MGPSAIVLRDGGKQFFTDFVNPPMDVLRKKKIECTRVDMVGHSMGGLMTKAFANSGYFRIAPNYRQGAIRRVVTIGTPHWGAGFASYLAGDDTYLRNKAFSEGGEAERRQAAENRATIALLLANLNYRTRNGEAEGAAIVSALVDLNLFSPVIRHLNEKACDIPTHLIVGEEAADNRVQIGRAHV